MLVSIRIEGIGAEHRMKRMALANFNQANRVRGRSGMPIDKTAFATLPPVLMM